MKYLVEVFNIDITNSNPAVLRFDGATFGNALGTPPGQALTDVDGANLAEVSLLSEIELNTMQPGSFTAVTLAFTALQVGESTLALAINEVGDALGASIGEIGIGGPLGVTVTPLPGAVALMASALGGLGLVAWSGASAGPERAANRRRTLWNCGRDGAVVRAPRPASTPGDCSNGRRRCSSS